MKRTLERVELPESVPLDCEQARGEPDEKQGTTCWYKLPKYRTLYPEWNFLNDDEALVKAFEARGWETERFHPWRTLFQYIALALGVPLAVFIGGVALLWVGEGFRAKRAESQQ
jgi:hypothetical protein